MLEEHDINYQPTNPEIWQGRWDGDTADLLRWHQVIKLLDIRRTAELQGAVVFLGFCCDEGVRRNQGRCGAKDAPDYLRSVLAGLPVHFPSTVKLVDAGNIICQQEAMESAQSMLSQCVEFLIRSQAFPIVIGGGHEITYGHFKGIQKARSGKTGIINLDAHLDMRALSNNQGNSGTSFYQIAEEAEQQQEEFHYLAIGVQDISNSMALFNYAASKSVQIIKASDIHAENLKNVLVQILRFAQQVDQLYLTIDLDVFNAAVAPGVSALAFNGIFPDHSFQKLFNTILDLPNLVSVDVAELNPLMDIDHRTAKLAADLLFKIVQKR